MLPTTNPLPPDLTPMHPNLAHAIYMDHYNRGSSYINDGKGPEFIGDWLQRKKQEYAEWGRPKA